MRARQGHVRRRLRRQRPQHPDQGRRQGSAGEESRRRPAVARGDHAALVAAASEHRPVPRLAVRGRLLQDHHGAGSNSANTCKSLSCSEKSETTSMIFKLAGPKDPSLDI